MESLWPLPRVHCNRSVCTTLRAAPAPAEGSTPGPSGSPHRMRMHSSVGSTADSKQKPSARGRSDSRPLMVRPPLCRCPAQAQTEACPQQPGPPGAATLLWLLLHTVHGSRPSLEPLGEVGPVAPSSPALWIPCLRELSAVRAAATGAGAHLSCRGPARLGKCWQDTRRPDVCLEREHGACLVTGIC